MRPLFQHDVARLLKHPMAVLPGLQLPQRHVDAGKDVLHRAQAAVLHRRNHAPEGGMKHGVMIDADFPAITSGGGA